MAMAYGYVPIQKFEKTADGTLMVYGPATDSSLDRDKQIADPAWLSKAMPNWFTQGGNLREQHDGKRAAGVALTYEKRDGDIHWIEGEVVDSDTIKKVEKRVLRGFSFGARNARVVKDDKAPGGRIVDGEIYEVSLVDRPANPNCLFTMAKAEGTGDLELVDEPELVEVDKADEPEPTFTPAQFAALLKSLGKTPVAEGPQALKEASAAAKAEGTTPVEDTVEKRDFSDDKRKELAGKGHALPDGSYPIETVGDLKNAIKAYGRASDPAAAKKHIIKRARALDATDQLPEDWGVSKADQVIADVRALVPGALAKADGGAFDPAAEASDVDNGKSAIAAIARLIISEAEGLAAGRLEEIWDIQTLVNAACALQCFVCSETDQEAELAMTDAAKADTAPAATETGEKPATPEAVETTTTEDATKTETTVDVIEKTDAPAEEALTKTDLSNLLEETIAKAVQPYKDELDVVKGQLAKVLETPRTDGPARLRTTTHTAVAAKADQLRAEIAHCQKSIPITGGDLQKGYRQRLDEAEAELAKLDGAAA
ncbi:hypothetical protein [Amycolatopsis pigmentata]|uniref:Prohead serine protease n=1 Tax=Amycolatopsis pigmentata TaxID=450801 RepID=A0ABW5G3S9_9PSEU